MFSNYFIYLNLLSREEKVEQLLYFLLFNLLLLGICILLTFLKSKIKRMCKLK